MMRCCFFSIGLVAAPLLLSALSFSGPEVLKLDWSTRALTVSDLNNDGLNDLGLINQDTAQIELLYQRSDGSDATDDEKRMSRNRWEPVLENATFLSDGVSVGFPVFDLAIGDLNGDGFDDMAYTSREVPLTIRYQSAAGSWAELEEYDNFAALGWEGTVSIADLDGDGRAELVVLAADAVRVFSHDESGKLLEPKNYYLTGENPYNLLLEDADNDGEIDILYLSSDGRQSFVVRQQVRGGGFGPERRFIFERPVRLIQVIPGLKKELVQFCSVDSRTGSLEFFELTFGAGSRTNDAGLMQPEVYPIFNKGRNSATYTMGDLNGDGLEDLLVANPGEAEVVLFLKTKSGFQPPMQFPSFSSISSMASGLFFDSKCAHVIIVSEAENSVGHSYIGQGGRVVFPNLLEVEDGNPVVCASIDVDRDGYDELVLITESRNKYRLNVLLPADRSDENSGWVLTHDLELEGMKRKPNAICALDVFGTDRYGLMVFASREAPVIFATKSKEIDSLEQIAGASTVRQNLLKDLLPSQVNCFDVTGDGANELVVGRKGYARALRFNDGEIEMVDQFNARRGEDDISVVIPFYSDDRVDHLLFFIGKSGELQSLKRESDGVFRYQASRKVGSMGVLGWHMLDSNSMGQEFVFFGDSQFWYLPVRNNSWSMQVLATYETELEDVHYTQVELADFNSDGRAEIVAVDGQKHVVEVLSWSEGLWSSKMYWEIFEQNMHYQGRKGGKLEPRQTVISDLNGDGALDFAFLIHDRILIYRQD